jgi:hypothetical protein
MLLRTPFALARSEQATLVPMLMRRGAQALEVKVGSPVRTIDEFGTWARDEIRAHPEDWVFWGKKDELRLTHDAGRITRGAGSVKREA